VNLPYSREASGNSAYQMTGVRIARQFDRLHLAGGATWLREAGTLLGAHLGKALGGSGSSTRMLDMRASWTIAPGWSLGGAYRQAWTSASRSGALVRGRLTSNAFAIDLSHTAQHSRMGLRIAQPMRVTSSRYLLDLPTGIDLETGAVTRNHQQLNLTPKGQEIDVEASYGRRFGPGWLNANLFLRNEPGNIAAAAADRGMTLRYSMNF